MTHTPSKATQRDTPFLVPTQGENATFLDNNPQSEIEQGLEGRAKVLWWRALERETSSGINLIMSFRDTLCTGTASVSLGSGRIHAPNLTIISLQWGPTRVGVGCRDPQVVSGLGGATPPFSLGRTREVLCLER